MQTFMTISLRCLYLVLLLAGAVYADSTTKESLRGLRSFSVIVDLEDGCPSFFSAAAIRTDVELKLRSVGLAVLDSNAAGLPDGAALAVGVTCLPAKSNLGIGAWAVCLGTRIMQLVRSRHSDSLIIGTTWMLNDMVFAPTSTVWITARSNLKDEVEEFLNEYLSVNPRN
jgi:hypothetical protein